MPAPWAFLRWSFFWWEQSSSLWGQRRTAPSSEEGPHNDGHPSFTPRFSEELSYSRDGSCPGFAEFCGCSASIGCCRRRRRVWRLVGAAALAKRREGHPAGCLGTWKFARQFRRRNSHHPGHVWRPENLHADGGAVPTAMAGERAALECEALLQGWRALDGWCGRFLRTRFAALAERGRHSL